ncbi:hypothetical protein CLV51_104397 [Chitinophaga niastensis]|uniref:Uncharacterized protein n=1 Tax=Chitinophaga niastensis TaxID=536980 RepID=A0A2P8HHN2_CHINA|nr:hypothetical protein [Chitinophaga niastensis]PSL45690.1 hypothetical protein CLV51_104397 [Chitinophaga niastensis]
MKKARIALAIIVIIAIVGGGLAVKAKISGSRIFCSLGQSQNCPLVLLNKTITMSVNAPTSFCTNLTTGTCLFPTHITNMQ